MLNSELEKNYQAGVETLWDIQALASEDIATPINRAYFHLSEVKRASIQASQNSDLLSSLPGIKNFLQQAIALLIEEQLAKSPIITQINYGHKFDNITSPSLDRMLAGIPHLFCVIKRLGLSGRLNIQMGAELTTVTGEIKNQVDLEQARVDVYAATRSLLKLGIFLTFKVTGQSVKRNLSQVELKLDYGHANNLGYAVAIKRADRQQIMVFSDRFACYLLPAAQRASLGHHHCVEITSDLRVKTTPAIPDHCVRESVQQEIIHFNFLFRPISLIIPNRGKIIPIVPTNNVGTLTGSGESCVEIQDETCRGPETALYIDIFKLLSK
ncbi:MAG: hypothetical protein HN353_10170 [Bdellovibrionales bacterium]|nr:hypothetical protein [Bdellovibrionales bacterium]MBT3527266.1 hypothetical protein [Bdellovibrionales bacterium]MBT7767157.1 hypothetical protein [Bdellovibrionales bacterium]